MGAPRFLPRCSTSRIQKYTGKNAALAPASNPSENLNEIPLIKRGLETDAWNVRRLLRYPQKNTSIASENRITERLGNIGGLTRETMKMKMPGGVE